jgi:GT2 family glycosyltransferase
MSSTPAVSVVIRTLNEAALLGRCLGTLRSQPGGDDLDIVVVDSGSQDSTVDIAGRFSARILEISRESFDYSRALNMGIDAAHGELIVMLSAHAIPREPDWLQRMVAPFGDQSIAGIGCRQIPWPDADWSEVRRLAREFPDVPKLFTQANVETMVFSNAASCIRRALWERFPFALPIAEDRHWARQVIDAGWTIVYEPSISVYHSHNDSAAQQARRLIQYFGADDIVNGTRRTFPLTAWQGAGLFYRDLRAITTLEEPTMKKLRYALTSLHVASRFVSEFGAPRKGEPPCRESPARGLAAEDSRPRGPDHEGNGLHEQPPPEQREPDQIEGSCARAPQDAREKSSTGGR